MNAHSDLPSDPTLAQEMQALFAIAEPAEVSGRARRDLEPAEKASLAEAAQGGLPRDKDKRRILLATLRKNPTALEQLAADLLRQPV